MLQIGVALFVFSALEGFAIPTFPAPRLGLSVHTLSALQGVMLLGLGLVWPRLKLGVTTSRVAFWAYLYSRLRLCFSLRWQSLFGAFVLETLIHRAASHGAVSVA